MHVPALKISRISSTDSEMPFSRTKFINTRRHEKARLVMSHMPWDFSFEMCYSISSKYSLGKQFGFSVHFYHWFFIHHYLLLDFCHSLFTFIRCQTPPLYLQAALWCAGCSPCREVLVEQGRGAVGDPIKHTTDVQQPTDVSACPVSTETTSCTDLVLPTRD